MQVTNKGIRETVNELFDQYILEAFEVVDPIIEIAQEFAYMGIGIMALRVFLNPEKRADILEYLRWVPLALLY